MQTKWLIELAKKMSQMEGLQGDFAHGTTFHHVMVENQTYRLATTCASPRQIPLGMCNLGGTYGEALRMWECIKVVGEDDTLSWIP